MKSIIRSGLTVILMLAALSACKEEVFSVELDSDQLIAGRLDGTWTRPSNMVTPQGVPPEVFGAMRLVFTTGEDGYPDRFMAQECPIIFTGSNATWKISGNEDEAVVTLENVGPVDEFKATVSSTTLTLSFHMGWENTDTGETGRGDFSVTLSRQ